MKKSVMSAEEGADRVHARWIKEGRNEQDLVGDPVYKCEACGHNQFVFVHGYNLVESFTSYVTCDCGEAEFAASRKVVRTTQYEESFELDDEHRPNAKIGTEKLDDGEEEEVENEVYCADCLAAHGDGEWTMDEEDSESEIKDSEYSVVCDKCGHEIEFGWSHPDRGGRVWPVESSDHNPSLSFPEERFEEAWKRRGWR